MLTFLNYKGLIYYHNIIVRDFSFNTSILFRIRITYIIVSVTEEFISGIFIFNLIITLFVSFVHKLH
jgi:hypothetical protein